MNYNSEWIIIKPGVPPLEKTRFDDGPDPNSVYPHEAKRGWITWDKPLNKGVRG